ncbi:MAG: AtpZ/AtpI family protein [SAR324 cluster bacterium]|nr:AtpZ/AtpI family protein [SAR324 cluster bacterium]
MQSETVLHNLQGRFFILEFVIMQWPAKNTRWVMFSSMGMELGLSVVVGFLIGSWLDGWLGTEPWLLLIFGAAGIIAGYRSIFRLLKKVQSEQEEKQSGGT